ncbi:hypothetical protein [Psychroflexus sediminis]|uniref:Uncharacterized protein n=1 Tax=Psychroflexus sediminis TaxID=470826 RepID=A0A1G7URV7_9FLAO|nr:hypothetical protein [Psychroflexus sediminis]SDG49991.1 hypothetical protein SAMN04488027_102233 [Psychroflexus sediminis]
MKYKAFLCIAILPVLLVISSSATDKRFPQAGRFIIEKDLLVVQFDCKTDVDDLHTVAAFKTLMFNPAYSKLNYHAVAGTYGMQEGLYVPPNALFQLAFGENWTNAHSNWKGAVETVKITGHTNPITGRGRMDCRCGTVGFFR